ncbi:MAG TPA: hypothetical protein PLE77_11880 [Kiritimatiellia bacterium]|nr:hypothetical protein [Kiritimatiellia bacterium]
MSILATADILLSTRASAATLRRKADARLRRLVEFAAAKVPYYRELFRGVGLKASDIHGVDDLRRIPITSRDDIQGRPIEDFTPEGMDASKLATYTTSGSSGKPLTVRQTPGDKAVNQALLLRAMVRWGMRPWHSKMSVRTKNLSDKDPSWHGRLGLFRRHWMSTRWPPDRWVTELQKINPDFIFTYCLTLRLMAQAIHERGITNVRPRCIMSSSGVLDDATRKEIGEMFHCPVCDVYASWEGGMLAWECLECDGYHVNSDWAVMEVLKGGEPALPGEQGEVVVTNLHSYGMPIIRYQQGDTVVVSGQKHTCGCHLPLIDEICGRTADMIVLPSGRYASPHAFMVMIDHVPGIQQWRLIQKEKARFILEVVASPDFDSKAEEVIRKDLFNLVGRPVSLEVVRVASLPESEGGKRRFVVCEVKVT